MLYDTKTGDHYFDLQIARLPVADILALRIPNENTIIYNKDGSIREPAKVFSFEVKHEPTPCMYPHCAIYALRDGDRPRKVASGIQSAIRLAFAQIAERSREEMSEYRLERKQGCLARIAIMLAALVGSAIAIIVHLRRLALR